MHPDLSLTETLQEWHGTLKSYLIGFLVSLVLTSASFILVVTQWVHGVYLFYTLAGLALVQAVIQLIFFLHLGQEAKPRWETLVFYFMLVILLIIAIGSLWIMYDLNERVMSGMSMGMNND